MRIRLWSVLILFATAFTAAAQQKPASPPGKAFPSAQQDPSGLSPEAQKRSEAYYQFAMGRLWEEYYDTTGRGEYATQAIEAYKRAYELDPRSAVIGEHLAEVYLKSQRIRDAVVEAQELLKREPDNLAARRLLARIYVRTMGDPDAGTVQRDSLARAIEQFREILRLDPADSESALWLARLLRAQNQHDEAEKILRGLLEREPENEGGVEQLTQLLLDEGRASEAVKYLERVTQHSASAPLLDLLGDAYTQLKDPAKAEGAYGRAVEIEPKEADYRRGLAQALIAQDKYAEAAEQYKKLTEIDPDEPDNYLRLAQIYREQKQLDAAERAILDAKQRAPGNLEVIYQEALIYEAEGRFEDAIRALSNAVSSIKAQPSPSARRSLAILYQQLGQLYRDTGNYQSAILTFQEMLKLGDEEGRRARLLIADTYRMARDLPKALEESRKALELYPRDRSVRTSHALLLGAAGQTDEAVKILRPMLSGAPDDREIYLDLAQVYERGRRYPDAEAAAHSAEALGGTPADNEMVWFMLGAIYERQKKFDKAEEQFKRVIELNPHNAPALNYYGYMLADQGVRLDEAVEFVKRALAEEPYNGAYLDSLGWAYFKQNRLTDAEKCLRQAVERDAHDPTIREHLGDVYFKTGRAELAAAEWDRSLAEWRRALPTESEADRIAALEKKASAVKQRLAQGKQNGPAKPQ